MRAVDRGARVSVELLYFDGCPHWRQAAAAVAEAARAAGVRPEVRMTRVSDPGGAVRLRFLGSPTVRVVGRDVEPGADQRSGYALACRLYESETGRVWFPPVELIAVALREAARR